MIQTRILVLQIRLVRIQKERFDAFVTLDLRSLDPCVSVRTIYNLSKLKINLFTFYPLRIRKDNNGFIAKTVI